MLEFLVGMVWVILGLVIVLLSGLWIIDTVTNKLPKLFDITHREQFGFWVALRYQIFGRSKFRSLIHRKPLRNSGQWSGQIYTPDEVRKILGATGHRDWPGVQ